MSRRRQKRTERVREPTEAEIAEQDLADACERLEKAVRGLVDREVELVAGAERETLSLYEEVVELCGGFAVEGSRGGRNASTPVWIDGISLLDEIDKSTREWAVDCDDAPSALRMLAAWQWTPDDIEHITEVSANVERWVRRAEESIDPRSAQVRRPCPACGGRHVYRRNSYGDSVRTATLQIDAEGVRCLSCEASWTYAQARFLQRLFEDADQKAQDEQAA